MSSIAPAQGGRNSLAYVYDGRECIGFVLARGKAGFEAFDSEQRSLGTFTTQQIAAAVISERKQPGTVATERGKP
jgi:hypothetical protein